MNGEEEGVSGHGGGGFGYTPPEIETETKSYGSSSSVIVRLTMKFSGGLLKNEKQANYVLLAVSVTFIIISLFLFFGSGAENNLEGEEALIIEEDGAYVE